ncbi:endonuclease [Pseudomonas sp. PA1(2017)]|uniref:HNH endonuclease n=1 Tax=Pseudomonas sp. PA1(2017) TaxID=1932113 RepID=UPI0009651481|nr:HNH endonuclease signature motif containing protein [Pseudomonas sp. PA1(2017)]OLU16979.1 endonuclease [Pseudomonas sp. PA1(2017)]
MMRLPEPPCTFEEAIDACVVGITGNNILKGKVNGVKAQLLMHGEHYCTSSRAGELYRLQPVQGAASSNPFILNDVTKSEFINLYDTYFVPEKKPARESYEKILNAARESCPFCGGIGTPRNLDHFLPKAHFPQFSILPSNLVPSCRDCNMDGKAAAFATTAELQIIQPYHDHDHFFQQQWIFAKYEESGPGESGHFRYFVHSPVAWTVTDKARASKHFSDFNLAHRYAVKAAQASVTVINQVSKLQGFGLGAEDIRETLLGPGADSAPFINHWQRGLYQALIDHYAAVYS